MTYVTGFHAMEELLKAGGAGKPTLLVAQPGPRVKRMIEEAKRAGLPVRHVSPAELDRLAPENRGAALALEGEAVPESPSLEAVLGRLGEGKALVVVLDHLEDPRNLGAVLRSADVFAADLVVIPERRSAKETDAVGRASAGASAYVPLCVVPNLARALETLKEAGFWLFRADMGGTPVSDADFSGRVGLVLGAEGKGVSRLVGELCDFSVSIPQYGHVDSLNVSVAAGILLFEARRKLGPPVKKPN